MPARQPALKRHPNFSQADFDALKAKGYSHAEIRFIWDRDTVRNGGQPTGGCNRADLALARLLADGEQHVARIAREFLGLETLETRSSDRLDFHDLAVWNIRSALLAAFDAGQRSRERQ